MSLYFYSYGSPMYEMHLFLNDHTEQIGSIECIFPNSFSHHEFVVDGFSLISRTGFLKAMQVWLRSDSVTVDWDGG